MTVTYILYFGITGRLMGKSRKSGVEKTPKPSGASGAAAPQLLDQCLPQNNITSSDPSTVSGCGVDFSLRMSSYIAAEFIVK